LIFQAELELKNQKILELQDNLLAVTVEKVLYYCSLFQLKGITVVDITLQQDQAIAEKASLQFSLQKEEENGIKREKIIQGLLKHVKTPETITPEPKPGQFLVF